MSETTRARIRHLYFVERTPLRTIAEALALTPRAVRAALVLPGGLRDGHEPAPMATARAPEPAVRLVTRRSR